MSLGLDRWGLEHGYGGWGRVITLHVLRKEVSFCLGDRGLTCRASRAGVVGCGRCVHAAKIIKARVVCRPKT